MAIIFATVLFLNVYPMMQESVYNRDEVEAVGYKIKNLDLIGYKNIGTTNTQNNFVEQSWRDSMETINALTNDKDLSGLKSLFNKVQEFGDAVFNAAKTMLALRDARDAMKDRIKVIDALKKKQSSMKSFLLGQKLKSAFSFGKKEEQYKKLKQVLLDTVGLLNNKVDDMKKEVEIKKK